MSTSIKATNKNAVTKITLNRPDKLNSFDDDMHRQLYAALASAQADDACRAILLTGADRAFCAGQDLSTLDPNNDNNQLDLSQTIVEFYNPLIRLIKNINKPIICAVNGIAAGAGANIALACDIVLAAQSAKFIQSFAKVGLIPDSGGSWTLPHLIGEARAKAIAMTATPVTAEQAQDWGMIWRAVADADLMNTAENLAAEMSQGPTFGLGLIKQAIQSASDNTLDQQLDIEAKMQAQCGRSPDYAEGVAAFMDKRAPAFSGEA